MSSTKIINVLKDDKFEEILDLFKQTSAQEVIFIVPKKAKAFNKVESFAALSEEASRNGKSISLLSSNPEMNQMAKSYKFDILLSPTSGSKKPSAILAVNQVDDGSINDDDPENPEVYHDEDFVSENLGDRGLHEEDEDLDEDLVDAEEEHGVKKSKKLDIEEDALEEEDLEKEVEEEIEEEEDLEELEDEFDDKDLKADDDEEEEAEDISFVENGHDYKAVTAMARKNLDDIISQSDTDIKNLKIKSGNYKPIKLEVRKESGDKNSSNVDEITEVWESDHVWDKMKPSSKSSWAGMFKFSNKPAGSYTKQRNSSGKKMSKIIMSVGVFAVVVLLSTIYIVSGAANVKIVPAKDPLKLELKISASDKYSSVDSNSNKIPGQLFNIEKSVSKSFSATGEKDVAQKAKGKIMVYNDLTVTQQLVATTRFETKEGLVFRTLKSITVPAAKSSSGTMEVEVIADKPGTEYNVAASDFIISAFKEKNDQERLKKVYGKSTQPMKGGTSGKAKVVTDQDYQAAKDALTEELKKVVAEALKSQSANLKIINSANVVIKDTQSTAQVDEAADNFTMTLTGFIKTIGFREEDISELVTKYVEKGGTSTVQADKLDKSYINIAYDEAASNLTFTAMVRGMQYKKIDADKILDVLLGKKDSQVRDYLQELKDSKIIDSAKVSLSPFWVKTVPKDKAKVKIEVVFE